MLETINPKNVLFLDIETVPQFPEFKLLPETTKRFWDKKSRYFRKEEETPEDVYQRAGIFAEFGKIVCVSVGAIIDIDEKTRGLKLKSFCSEDELSLLNGFSEMLTKFESNRKAYLCAHNGKEFDFPYLSRRMLINGVKLPNSLDNSGKKPWEVAHIDSLELWKFGDYKHYTSLDLLTHIFGIPSPKEEIDGSMVAEVFYVERDMEKIRRYCENDVIALTQLIMKFLYKPQIKVNNIIRTG